MAAALASIAVPAAGKCAASMAAENCFAENNYSSIANNIWPRFFSARSAIFCRYWTCTFSCRNNQAIGPRLSAIFTFLF